jgi:hypothetical protein
VQETKLIRFKTQYSRRLIMARKGTSRKLHSRTLSLEALEGRDVPATVWTQLNNLPLTQPSQLSLLTDGRVMLQSDGTKEWAILSADSQGNYASGAWSPAASMIGRRYAYASNTLPNGRLLVLGGERGENPGLSAYSFMSEGEIYDPATNTWSAIDQSLGTPLTGNGWGAHPSPSILLPSGTVLVGYRWGPAAAASATAS